MHADILNTLTILYVEDDRGMREVYGELLSERCHKVYLATNGKDGYQQFKEHKPDIIISDIMMPEVSGIEMSRKIREEDQFIPIIIASAKNDHQYLEETLDIGINGYMAKPINADDLFELLKSIGTILELEDEKKIHEKFLKDRFNMQQLLV